MAKGSESPLPSVLFDEQAADPATPPADRWRLFAKSGGIYARNAAGTVVGPFAAPGAAAFHGAKVYSATAQNINATSAPLTLEAEDWDTDGYHFPSAAALTGTVAKTAASAVITGTGTAFTTELSVNQVVSIPGTAVEFFCVKSIESDTQFTAWAAAANSASGQPATRRNEFIAIPAGQGGKYSINAGAVSSGAGGDWIGIYKNGLTTQVRGFGSWDAARASYSQVSTDEALAEGDFVCAQASTTANINIGSTAAHGMKFLSVSLIGS